MLKSGTVFQGWGRVLHPLGFGIMKDGSRYLTQRRMSPSILTHHLGPVVKRTPVATLAECTLIDGEAFVPGFE